MITRLKILSPNTSSNSKELNTEWKSSRVPTEKVNQDKSSSGEENTDKDSSVGDSSDNSDVLNTEISQLKSQLSTKETEVEELTNEVRTLKSQLNDKNEE